jgi:hypothetical protein
MKSIFTSPDSLKIKQERQKKRRGLSRLIFFLFLTIVGALAYFSGHEKVIINKVVVTGAKVINSSIVEKIVSDNLKGRYFYLFAKANSLIYPKKEIINNLTNTYPRIKELDVYKANWSTVHIVITERSGSYLYCGSSIPEAHRDIGENCYFINDDGYIFDKAPYFSGNVYFKYYLEIPEKASDMLGQYVMPIDDFHNLSRFVDGVASVGFEPIYLTKKEGEYSIYLKKNQEDIDHKIIFNTDSDLDLILIDLSAAMKKPEFADEINSKYTTLQYIDLRFKNKVLYKF